MLAQSLGMSVARCKDEVDAEEFAGWQTYWRSNPEHEHRADLRNGIACSLLANINRKENSDALEPIDFMPFTKREEKKPVEPSVSQLEAMVKMWAHAQNAAVAARGGK